MGKLYIRSLFFAQSRNFSDLQMRDGKAFDIGDDGKAVKTTETVLQMDALLLLLLRGMDDRQKVILLLQLLRDNGYNLNHEDCASIFPLTRERYMVLLKEVRQRARKILQMPTE